MSAGYLWTVTLHHAPREGDLAIGCAGAWGRDYASADDAIRAMAEDETAGPDAYGVAPTLQLTRRPAEWIAAGSDGHGEGDRQATAEEVRASLRDNNLEGYCLDAAGNVGYVTPGAGGEAWIGTRGSLAFMCAAVCAAGGDA
jgi:hypothetical protein